MGLVGATLGDALIAAGASISGDVVYTSDLEDFERLQSVFLDVVVARVRAAGTIRARLRRWMKTPRFQRRWRRASKTIALAPDHERSGG